MPSADVFALLTQEGIKNGLNGSKFRTTKTQQGEARKQQYLQQLAINSAEFDALQHLRQQLTLSFRRALIEALREKLEQRMQQLNIMSFDQLITRLAEALHSDKGALLTAAIQQRFQVALIDEFQDTDQHQWFIFSSLFAGQQHYLYLIGDPKQAIYKFRGADIYSYFTAQQQAQHKYTLAYNWRSHPALVDAVNQLFDFRQDAFYSSS